MDSENLRTFDMLGKIEDQLDEFLKQAQPNRHRAFFEGASIREGDVLRFVREAGSDFRIALRENPNEISGMPKIVHRLWITSAQAGFMPPEDYLRQIARQATFLGKEYSYVFWCNSDEIGAKIDAFFAGCGAPIEVRNLVRTFPGSPLLPVIEGFIQLRKYVLASDVAKFVILHRFGGVYADLGIQFSKELLALIQRADVALFLDVGMFFQPAFMAFKRESDIVCLWCQILRAPEILSAVIFGDLHQFTAGQEVWLHGGLGFTAVFMLFRTSCSRVIVLPPQGTALQTHSQGSWYKDGNKFGNLTLNEAKPSHIDVGSHQSRVAAIKELDRGLLSLSPADLVRYKILSGLQEYFWLR